MNACYYFAAYTAKSELSTHSILTLTTRAFIESNERQKHDSTYCVPTEDLAHKLIVRSVMKLIGSVEISGPLAAITLLRPPWLKPSHEFEYIPFGNARAFLCKTREHLADSHAGPGALIVQPQAERRTSDDSESDMDDIPAIVQSNMDEAKVYSSSKLINYVKRPSECDHMSLMEFFLCTTVTRAQNKDTGHACKDKSSNGQHQRGRKAVERFKFQADHPSGTSADVIQRHNDPMHGVIPILTGGIIPPRDVSDDMYCLSVLALFVPWRNASSLTRCADESWSDVYLRMVTILQSDKLPAWVCNYLNNVQLLHVQGRARNADLMRRAQRESEILGNCYASTQSTSSEQTPQDVDAVEYFNNMIILLSDAADPSRYSPTEKGVITYVTRAVGALSNTIGTYRLNMVWKSCSITRLSHKNNFFNIFTGGTTHLSR